MGRSPVKSTFLYVKNIYQEEGTTDDDIIKQVKSHCSYYGIRVMSARVIKNRFVDDVVGCKITVPEDQAHLCLRNHFWPKPIECREWQSNRPRRKDSQLRSSDVQRSNETSAWRDRDEWTYDNHSGSDSSHLRSDQYDIDNQFGWYDRSYRH